MLPVSCETVVKTDVPLECPCVTRRGCGGGNADSGYGLFFATKFRRCLAVKFSAPLRSEDRLVVALCFRFVKRRIHEENGRLLACLAVVGLAVPCRAQ
jgi:hypothetical protein